MLRLLGFLTGAGLVAWGLLYAVDEPAAQRAAAHGEQAAAAALDGLRQLPATLAEHAPVVTKPVPRPGPVEPAEAPPSPAPAPADLTRATTVTAAPMQLGEPEPLAPATDPNWYPLWQPFRSELSARGFAEHIARLTGRELRVSGDRPGGYRVLLGHRDAADLEEALREIAARTGLQASARP